MYPGLPLYFVLGWPVLILVVIGLVSLAVGFGSGVWWLVSHLQWVW